MHPARGMAFADLYSGLKAEEQAGNVTSKRHGPLEMFTYTPVCVYEKRWSVFSLMARGLIVDVDQQEVVATPFPKFFNYGEAGGGVPQERFQVTEKLDGSMGTVFYHGGRWKVATKGSFTSPQAQWAEAWLHAHARLSNLEPGTTYLPEIIYPENRIVVGYDFAGLVLLTAYDHTGRELPRSALVSVAEGSGLQVVQVHTGHTVKELLDLAKALKGDREGFVVRFTSGLRIKIKGDEYCRIHRLISNCTPLAVWEAMAAGDDLEAMRRDLPEEFRGDFDTIVGLLRSKLEAFRDALAHAVVLTSAMTDPELGIAIQTGTLQVAKDVQGFIFACRKQGFLDDMGHGGKARRKAFQTFRPTGNALEGYRPSSAMNRFEAEQG